MRSRWYHPPLLHSPSLGLEKKPTWLELFYDLVFVAAFIQLGNGLAAHVDFPGFVAFAGLFVALWVAWTGFTFFENRFTLDDFAHRITVFGQMFAVGAMALSAPRVVEGETFAFSIASGMAQLIVALMYLRAYREVPEARDYSRYWGMVFGGGGLLWLIAAFLPPTAAYLVWGLATIGVISSPLNALSRALAERFPIDFEHLGERYGLLTLIVLGESFVKVLSALVAEESGGELYGVAAVALLITCSLWWVYFDDVAGSKIRRGRGQWIVWLYSHIPLQIGITAVGVAVKKAMYFSLSDPAPEAYRWLLSGALALALASVAAVDSVTERRQAELSDRVRINARWISAALLLVLAPAGRALSGGLFLGLVATVALAQVIFDMMMAPFEEHAHAELGARTTADLARERERAGPKAGGKPRRDVSETVRKGTPSSLRRDLYFYFIEGSWPRVFVSLGFLFLVANLFFSALYLLEPGSIRNAATDSFADAFFFSVQTMSTVGYGGLTPGTSYGNVVMTIEAAMSMIGVAIVTGLVFAKVSRPRSSVLFSRSMVLTTMGGKRVLMLRAGNARGNEVVDASMTVTALMDELSPEGHHFRRLHDLQLVRKHSPMFMLSWTVMHEIDERSPLAGVDFERAGERIISFITTLTGHDGTYGQTIYARHVHWPEDLRVGERFVDVISELEDGRLMIDYSRFHETEPDRARTPGVGGLATSAD